MSDPKQASQSDPRSPQGGGSPTNDPSASPTAQQQGQQGQKQNGDEDEELAQFLQKEHGHTKSSADAEVKRDREGVKKKKKEHEEKHGGGSSYSRR